METNSRIKRWLSAAAVNSPTSFSAYCIVAAFGTYFCMYAFRKPFTAATYEGHAWLGLEFKTVLVAAQVSGYTLSKFIGIKVVSEMPPKHRAITVLGLIGIAEVALALFAVTPVPWNFIWLFANGLPLGMVFGLVIGFLEGRRMTEALSAGLCASFILASGFVKSVGRAVIEMLNGGPIAEDGVEPASVFWMPFLTGLIFVIPLLGFVWLLSQIPPPSEEDEAQRARREPMQRDERWAFLRWHWLGLSGLLLIYVLITIIRSIRDDFGVEIWKELGVGDKPAVFATSEFWVAIAVTAVSGLMILVKNNRTAFLASIALIVAGFGIVLAAVVGQKSLSPMAFMVLLGFGLYVPYVAFHTTIFERMLAVFREPGTLGFLMCLADAVGYLGYVGVMIARNTATEGAEFLPLINKTCVVISLISTVVAVLLIVHYFGRTKGTSQ